MPDKQYEPQQLRFSAKKRRRDWASPLKTILAVGERAKVAGDLTSIRTLSNVPLETFLTLLAQLNL